MRDIEGLRDEDRLTDEDEPTLAAAETSARLSRRLVIAFALVVLIPLVSVGFLLYRGRQLVTAANAELSRSHDLGELQSLLLLLNDAETAERGFVITGNLRYLGPWERASTEIPTTIDRLAPVLSDDVRVQVGYEELRVVIRDLMALHERTIAARREQGFVAAAAIVESNLGIAQMDRARELVTGIQAVEFAASEELLLSRRSAARQTAVLAAGGGGLIVLTLLSTFWFIQGEMRRREEAQAALRLQNEQLETARVQLRAILDASSEAMLLVDRDGRFLAVNARYEDFFGLSAGQVVGRLFSDIARDYQSIFADPETLIGAVRGSARDRERIFTLETTVLKPQPRLLLLYSTPVPSTDGLARVFAFRDITRERESERLKSQFVSMVSHELRTPLTSIKGYIDLLLDGESGELSTAQQELLRVVQRNGDRLLLLVSDLLEAARLEAGRLDVRSASVDLVPIVNSVVVEMQVQTRDRQQQVVVELPSVRPVVIGDPDRLHQILMNLVSNASKYSPQGTTIRITAERRGDEMAISVTDQGIGLSADDLHRVFDRFFRAKHSATQHTTGTGLGLYITRSLVELQGGSMSVDSELGVGSTFTFTVPTARTSVGLLPVGGAADPVATQ